jgi:hypothetical protein
MKQWITDNWKRWGISLSRTFLAAFLGYATIALTSNGVPSDLTGQLDLIKTILLGATITGFSAILKFINEYYFPKQ